MSNFMEELRKNSEENTYEKRQEKRRQSILESMFEEIKDTCMRTSRYGGTSNSFWITELLKSIIGDDEYDRDLLFKSIGEGHPKGASKNVKAYIDPERVKKFLETNLEMEGFKNYKLIPREIPLYNVTTWEEELPKEERIVNGVFNFLVGADLNTETRTRKKREEIGKQIIDFRLEINWD